MEDVKKRLIAGAHAKGICADGYKAMLNADDAKDMVDYYVANPDWCMERGFPDLQTLKTEFADCEDKGVFVNKVFHGELLNDLQTYIFHNCKGTIKVGLNVEKGLIPMLYLGNGCRLRIVGTGDWTPKRDVERSVVPVYTFGKNDLSARDNIYVMFNVYKNDLI